MRCRVATELATSLAIVCCARAATGASDPSPAARDGDCLVCHAGYGEKEAPKIDLVAYRASSHQETGCTGCHADIDDDTVRHEEIAEDLAQVTCGRCHEEAARGFEGSIHDAEEVDCAACHGAHDILAVSDLGSKVSPRNQPATCGHCHADERRATAHTRPAPLPERGLGLTPRHRDLLYEGFLVAATCSDCHGAHDVLAASGEDSGPFAARVASTCGRCHQDARDALMQSVHAAGADARESPTCTRCHRLHADTPKALVNTSEAAGPCGECHEDLARTYASSYHGQASHLGDRSVARCWDCHEAHAVRSLQDPLSTASVERKLATCRRCHEDAPAGFAEFRPHADPRRPDAYPALALVYASSTAFLIAILAFFGSHSVLWAVRESIEAVRRRQRPTSPWSPPPLDRFSRFDRGVHVAVAIAFIGLAVTGAPLAFAGTTWARSLLNGTGGVSAAGSCHRLFAIVAFGAFIAHLVRTARRLQRRARAGTLREAVLGPDTLLPGRSDLHGLTSQFYWFFGRGPRPYWNGWTYWEKLNYWSAFFAVLVLGATGLCLWFPTLLTSLLPGSFLNVAQGIHSRQALLGVGFVIAVHVLHVVLRRAAPSSSRSSRPPIF